MPIEVELPDGAIVEFPDGTDNATMERALRAYSPAPARAAGTQPGAPSSGPGVRPAAPSPEAPDRVSELSLSDLITQGRQPQDLGPDPAAGMSMIGRLLVGTGRGASGVYQGIKQIGLQAGEKVGAVEPGTADAYTRQVQEEHELYDRYSKGLGTAGKIGEIAGSALAVPVPGVGAGAGLAGRLGGAAAMGGLQGGLEFVPEEGSRLQNVGVGALAGLGAQGVIGEPLRIGASRVTALLRGGQPSITDKAAQAVDYAGQRGLPIFYDDIAGSGTARALGTFTDDLPLIGTGETRKAQAEAAGQAAQDLVSRFDTGGTGRPAETLKESAQRQLARAKDLKNELYRDAFAQLNTLGDFDLPGTKAFAQRMIAHNQAKGSLADPTLMAELQRYVDAPAFNFEGWHGARSELGNTIRSQMVGENAVLSDSATAQLRTFKAIMDSELSGIANKAGNVATAAWKRADNFYKSVIPKYKRGVVADLLKSKNPDAIADRILDGKDSGGIARQVYQALDRDGRAEVRSTLLQRAMDKATTISPDGGESFSPAQFAKELERVQNRTAAFFRKEDRLEIEGLQNYMQFIKRAGQYAANPPTGKRVIPHIALLAGTSAVGPKTLAAYGTTALTSRLLLRTTAGRNLLLRMGSVSPGTRAAEEVAQAINAYLQRGAASEANGLTLDIVGGTPGPAVSEAELQQLRAR